MNDNVKVYTALTEGIDEEALKAALDKLPRWRADFIEKRAFSEKINGAFAYLLLEYAAKREFGEFDLSPFTYTSSGKPYFAVSDLYFSISHCKTAVGAAVSRSEMGLDVLDYRTVNEKIAFKICTDEEMRQFEAAEDKQKFLQLLWCKKESAVKKTGVGFTAGFKTVKTEELDFSIKIFPLYTAAVCGGGETEFKEISWKELIK